MRQLLDPPPIPRRQLHDLSLEPALISIAGDGLGLRGSRLVIRADPGREPWVGHLARDIGVDGGDQLVMQMFFLAVLRGQDRVDAFA